MPIGEIADRRGPHGAAGGENISLAPCRFFLYWDWFAQGTPSSSRQWRINWMADSDERNATVDVLGQLSELMVDAVRELRRQRQPVTANTFRGCLENRTELRRLLRDEALLPSPPETSPTPTDTTQLETQLRVLGQQKARLLGDVTQLEEQQEHLWEFTTGALLTLTAWLELSSGHAPFRGAIERFKARLKEADNLAGIEDSFLSLKDQILKENPAAMGDGDVPTAAKFSLRNWFGSKGREPDHEAAADRDERLPALNQVLTVFINEFEPLVPNSRNREVALVKGLISRCRTHDDLLNLREPLSRLAQLGVRSVQGERDQFVRLIEEIDQNLKEMEKNLLDSLGQARAMVESNTDLSAQMNQGMEEMSASMQASQDLNELRQVVVTKLAFLRQALESKHRDDERRLARATEKLDDLQRNVVQMRQEVTMAREQSRQLEEQLQQDALTGVLSRRGYEERIAQEFERYQRYRHMVSVIVFDLDHFKRVNDQFGHQTGDKCLKVISTYIQPVIRKSDALARYGGDEFVLILPGIDGSEAVKVAEKIRRLVEQIRFLYEGKRIPLTLSMGVAQAGESDPDADNLFKRADQALFAAKEEGRNRVKIHDDQWNS